MDTTLPSPWATAGRVLVGVAVSAAASFHALFWLLVGSMQCDESCDGGSWHATAGAWQWSAMTALGFASWLLAVAFAIALGTRRDRGGKWLLVGAIATAIAPWILVSA